MWDRWMVAEAPVTACYLYTLDIYPHSDYYPHLSEQSQHLQSKCLTTKEKRNVSSFLCYLSHLRSVNIATPASSYRDWGAQTHLLEKMYTLAEQKLTVRRVRYLAPPGHYQQPRRPRQRAQGAGRFAVRICQRIQRSRSPCARLEGS
jgi:hypothetical protein